MISTMPALNSKEFDYARLISELNAIVGFNDVQLTEVAESMSLELSDVQALIDSAEHVFQNAKPKDGIRGVIEAEYVSIWAEGRLDSKCLLNLDSFSISDIEMLDDTFEHHEYDFVEVVINGIQHQLEAADGELTEAGKASLAKITIE